MHQDSAQPLLSGVLSCLLFQLQIFILFYFILFYSYTDLAVELCRTSRYMFVSPENLWRNKNWSLGETRENLEEYTVAKEICTCSYLLKQIVDLVELRKRVGGLD